MKRSKKAFPLESDVSTEFLEKCWKEGWLDEYSDDHFVIRALEGRLTSFELKDLLKYRLDNNAYSKNDESFGRNFLLNFSPKLGAVARIIGKESARSLIVEKLSAGKKSYSDMKYYQSLSELSLFVFLIGFGIYDRVIYEPKTNGNKNPEMRFVIDKTSIDIEVKTPNFDDVDFENSNYTITTTLLDDDGRELVKKLEKKYQIKSTLPRIKKIVDYLNSAADKFVEASDNQINILFINWTYTDAAYGGIVEPASLLSNKNNGILYYPEIGKMVGVKGKVYKNISAVVVYCDNMDGLMFCDFRYVWSGYNSRLYVINDNPIICSFLHMNKSEKEEDGILYDVKYGVSDGTDKPSRITEYLDELIRIVDSHTIHSDDVCMEKSF